MNTEVIKNFFVRDVLFKNLTNLNEGARDLSEYFFSEHDFERLLERVEAFGVGIEYISPVGKNNVFIVVESEVMGYESTDPEWYWNGYRFTKDIGQRASLDLIYNASFIFEESFLYSYFVSLN